MKVSAHAGATGVRRKRFGAAGGIERISRIHVELSGIGDRNRSGRHGKTDVAVNAVGLVA